jgi:hypothetical protein
MKILLYLLAALLLVSLIITIIILLRYANDKIKVRKKDIQNIIIVDYLAGIAKQITRKPDIEAICDAINSTKMNIVKNPDLKSNGIRYVFILNDNQITISCLDGGFLQNNGNYYRISSTNLEDFWNLNYEEVKYYFSGIC